MKKGDLKKKEIIQTAETLFCKNGYETTSIQDILDVLHTSKGSFYHHFASKELLLAEICRLRAEEVVHKAAETIKPDSPPMDNLNAVLTGIIPLSGEKLSFLMMILPVFDLPEGRQIRFSYAEALSDSFRQIMIHEIHRGNENGDLFCTDVPHAADIVFLILNELWYQICLLIIRNEKKQKQIDSHELLYMVASYRRTLERVLGARFGSIRLLEMDDLKYLTDQIHVHWNSKTN